MRTDCSNRLFAMVYLLLLLLLLLLQASMGFEKYIMLFSFKIVLSHDL